MLLEFILLTFFMYCSIVCKSDGNMIVFVVITTLYCSIHMKSALTSDLIFLSTLFKLVICELDKAMKFTLLLLSIEMIICL